MSRINGQEIIEIKVKGGVICKRSWLFASHCSHLRYIQHMPDPFQIVLCTVPDRDTAGQIAEALVSERLAACVNIVADITSVYRWKGEVEKAPELLLIIKTRQAVYETLQDRIQDLHPYELPEVIAVSIDNGLPAYLDWIKTTLEGS